MDNLEFNLEILRKPGLYEKHEIQDAETFVLNELKQNNIETLSGVNLSNVDFTDFNFNGVTIENCLFSSISTNNIDFTNSTINNVRFYICNFKNKLILKDAKMKDFVFDNCYFNDITFTENLDRVLFHNCNFHNTNFNSTSRYRKKTIKTNNPKGEIEILQKI